MVENQDLYGTTRSIPGDGDTNWGPEIRTLLVDLCKGLDSLSRLIGSQAFLSLPATNEVFTSDEPTLTIATPRTNLKSNSGSVDIITVDEITAGEDGQVALLIGDKDNTSSKFVKLTEGSTTNVTINGDMQLKPGAAIYLMWDASDSAAKTWRELSRSI